MARPESVSDIEVKDIEFASISLDKIATDGTLMKGYTAFIQAVNIAGAAVEMSYGSATFTRKPTQQEMRAQLETAQSAWDEYQKYYDMLRTVGDVEHDYQRRYAERHAKAEGLPWPPEVEPSLDIKVA